MRKVSLQIVCKSAQICLFSPISVDTMCPTSTFDIQVHKQAKEDSSRPDSSEWINCFLWQGGAFFGSLDDPNDTIRGACDSHGNWANVNLDPGEICFIPVSDFCHEFLSLKIFEHRVWTTFLVNHQTERRGWTRCVAKPWEELVVLWNIQGTRCWFKIHTFNMHSSFFWRPQR